MVDLLEFCADKHVRDAFVQRGHPVGKAQGDGLGGVEVSAGEDSVGVGLQGRPSGLDGCVEMLYQAGENLLHLLRLAVQGFPVGGVLLCGLGRVDGDDLEAGRLVLAVIQEGSVGADGTETGGRIVASRLRGSSR